jgi:hypothetical protein
MKNKTVNIIIVANLAVLLLLVIFVPHLMIQPGKLIDAHLDLTDDCFSCHTPFIGSTADKCIQCHKVNEIGLKTTEGLVIAKEKKNVAFHQQLIEDDCVACHSDHKGVQSFRPIGQFSHQLVAREMQEQCDGCHSNPGDALHLKIKGTCSQCHTIDSWTPATFNHEKYFRFDKHHDAACEKCHIESDYSNYTCYGCHEHSRSKIREEHVEEGIRDYERCVECHRSGDEDEAEYLWKLKRRGLSPQDYPAYKGRKYDDNDHDDHDD